MKISKSYGKFFFILSMFLLLMVQNISASSDDREFPFKPGEKLKFELKWGVITAGEATLEVLPFETINGVKAWHFLLTTKTTPFIDLFYKVRDRIDAYADYNMTHSLLFKKKQQEGKSYRDIVVEFDWEKKEAQYSNFGEKRDPIPLLDGSFDPLSAFYYTRMVEMKKHSMVARPVTDGKFCSIGKVFVKKKETIVTDLSSFETFVLEPELNNVGGVFEKQKNAKIEIWLSTDKRRIPVRIASTVIIGYFTGELISVEGTVE